MGRKYFKAPYDKWAYFSLVFESKKFTVTKDKRYIVATEPLTLREYYVAFYVGVPFKAFVEDKAELVVPDDLDTVAEIAKEVRRGRGRIFLRWWTIEWDNDIVGSEEVEIIGNFSRRGLAEVKIRGYAEIERPYICEDPDDCMRLGLLLTSLYDLTRWYKKLRYRGPETVELAVELLERGLGHVLLRDADINEVEELLKKKGEVLNLCKRAYKYLQIEKSRGRFLIDC
jgi:hypothetical protein